MTLKFFTYIVVGVVAIWLCFSGLNKFFFDRQLACFNESQKKIETSYAYQSIEKTFKDTLNKWIVDGIRTVQNFRFTEWKIDALLLNTKGTRGLVLVPRVDKRDWEKLDYITFFAMEYQGGKWNFYSSGLPTIIMPRELNPTPGRPYTLDELGLLGRGQAIQGGYFRGWLCAIDDSYIDDWFTGYLYKNHAWFLNDVGSR